MIILTVGPEYNSRTPVCTNGPEVRKPWERSQRIFQTAGRKPLDPQRETVGEPFPLGLRGSRGRKERGIFKGLLLLLRTFFFFIAQALPRERVVSPCFLEPPAVGLLGLRIVISSRQPLDCWGSTFLGLPAVGLPELCGVESARNRERNHERKSGRRDGGPPTYPRKIYPSDDSVGRQGKTGVGGGPPCHGMCRLARPPLERFV